MCTLCAGQLKKKATDLGQRSGKAHTAAQSYGFFISIIFACTSNLIFRFVHALSNNKFVYKDRLDSVSHIPLDKLMDSQAKIIGQNFNRILQECGNKAEESISLFKEEYPAMRLLGDECVWFDPALRAVILAVQRDLIIFYWGKFKWFFFLSFFCSFL